jgi:hypothetical protein
LVSSARTSAFLFARCTLPSSVARLLHTARFDVVPVWRIIHVFEDPGISGAKGRDKRPQFDALMKAVARREIDAVAAW